ncbi:hypothetical protein D3C78_1367860 [compost metagenome]
MHTDEILRPGQGTGQVVNAQARRVGGDYAVARCDLFQFAEDAVLDVQVLDNRLDHNVYFTEVGVLQLRQDRLQHLTGAGLGQPSTLDCLSQELLGLGQAEVQLALIDVFKAHRRAMQGAGIGDAAPHDSSAQHSPLPQWQGL